MSAETLHDKTLVMVVGPSAIGKSTLMNEAVRQHADFGYVRSFTTREQRPGETSHYEFISQEDARALRENGQAITYFEHPTTHDAYGTTARSFPARYNLLDTLSGSVGGYRGLPFERTVTVSLTAPPEQWQQWFLSRYPTPSEEARKRLGEAVLSINWSLMDEQTYWLSNPKGRVAETANTLVNIATVRPPRTTPPAEPRAMLDLIERGIWS